MTQNPFKVTILTLYPKMFPSTLDFSLAKRGLDKGLWSLDIINIRDFAKDKNKTVDDYVYGGGDGMLLKPDVLSDAIEFAFEKGASKNLVYPSPKGQLLKTSVAKDLSVLDGITFICGHFEGIDERMVEKYNPMQISLGDFILSGGELACIVIIDSTLRFLPNMLNSISCVEHESFHNNLLEYPQYTRPYIWNDMKVPDVLISGNHKEIEMWRLRKSEELTEKNRPDLFKLYTQKK